MPLVEGEKRGRGREEERSPKTKIEQTTQTGGVNLNRDTGEDRVEGRQGGMIGEERVDQPRGTNEPTSIAEESA